MTPGGRKKTQRAIVVVGNKNGVAGKNTSLGFICLPLLLQGLF